MSKLLSVALLVVMASFAHDARAEGTFVLEKVFPVDGDPARPASWAADGDNVYDVQFAVRYNSDDCIGNYRVQFVFDRDVTTLQEGEIFTIDIRKIFGEPPCGHKWTDASVQAAGGLLPEHPDVPTTYDYNENIEMLRDGYIRLWDTPSVEARVTLQAVVKKDTPYTKLALWAGDNAMYFIYRYVADGSATSGGDGSTASDSDTQPKKGEHSPYCDLIETYYCPNDSSYEPFTDYGWWDGGSDCGQSGLPAGFYVYDVDTWYIYGKMCK
ncbi:MAG: hypothetical protein AAF563_14125 [Pseudomonadota bacterium]